MRRNPGSSLASLRTVAKDEHNRWICRIERNIDRCSDEQAKLWVIYDGLQLAWSAKWTNIIVETDCALAIEALNDRLRG
ncbi:hypothetical protein J1N35_033896 [Gossypium stocksii]|uniref:RNase H type-1 domain-containing protein n=1 Tax=Gossypium stocksii TaxID=47602 RepID=A0A9D3UQY9_9ROSI|nr:hypothetical protein J1N35_033896 [Gossypium stocksii]